MDSFMEGITGAEREFYGDSLILLEGMIREFLSCVDMIRRYRVSRGGRDPVTSCQARIKSAESMRQKLKRRGLPVTARSALEQVWDAAGVRLVCPFVQDIYDTARLVRAIPGVKILQEKDYIHAPKPNGYRSYHMVVTVPIYLNGEMVETKVEIQIRTVAMDFWASLEHKIYYKFEGDGPENLQQELKACADMVDMLDAKMYSLNERILEVSREQNRQA